MSKKEDAEHDTDVDPQFTSWENPLDGSSYSVGDIIPRYTFDNSGALVYGEPCVFMPDPGFPGTVVVRNPQHPLGMEEVERNPLIPEDEVIKERLVAIEPDPSVFYIGPESPGWRWFYARRSTLISQAVEVGIGNDDMTV